MSGQEKVCSNITITDDFIVEATETFLVSLELENTTFSAGVSLLLDTAIIEIADIDGKT